MSSSDEDTMVENESERWSIFAAKSIKVNENFLVNFSKQITNEDKRMCKILQFTKEWTFHDILNEIHEFCPKMYENVFIFVLDESITKEEFESLCRALESFGKSRPIIIQLLSVDEIYFKDENSENFQKLEENGTENEKVSDFPSFFRWLMKTDEIEIQNILSVCPIERQILRLLSIFDIDPDLSFAITLNVAKNSSKFNFLAALDVPFDSDERLLGQKQVKQLKTTIDDKSILKASIDNESEEIVAYLIAYCSHIIQQLPFDHQLEVVDQLVDENKIELLCDLLEFSDFPFPNDFDGSGHERLEKIICQRNDLHVAIEDENFEEIAKFIEDSNLKIAYNMDHESALFTALKNKNFNVFFHLISVGFKELDCDELKSNLTTKEKLEMKRLKNAQMKDNLRGSIADENRAVELLVARSKIYRRGADKQDKKKIREWYEAIWRVKNGNTLLNASSQCENLQIFFDYGSDSTLRMDLESDFDGVTYRREKLIIIGAKFSSSQDEQRIKGVVAHELCHYVLGIVFQNYDQPYFNELDPRYQKFKDIVDKYSRFKDLATDDQCDGIISSVFRQYSEQDYHAELIVRVVHLLVHYDDDPLKVVQLQQLYEDLFTFYNDQVVPEMNNLNMKERIAVRSFNKFAGFLTKISRRKLEFRVSKSIDNLIKEQLVVVKSNTPRLLLIDVFNYLSKNYGKGADTIGAFASQEKLDDAEILNDFKDIIELVENLSMFLDFSSGNFDILKKISRTLSSCKCLFIVSNENQKGELLQKLTKRGFHPASCAINYEWQDLEPESQNHLLNTKIEFQNNPNISLFELLKYNHNIIDSEVLNAILKDTKISINCTATFTGDFDRYFRERTFVCGMQQIPEENILQEMQDHQFVLISDVAGTGKSWAMKKIMKIYQTIHPTKWTSFVNLKEFISIFKENKKIVNFYAFMLQVILKEKSKLEVDIFELMYSSGDVIIFFDGFDEIAPDCNAVVGELIISFKCNESNKMWISTRDLFEGELQKLLNNQLTCKLDDFTMNDGIELIAAIWTLDDSKTSEEFIINKELALELCTKIPKILDSSIGLPLMYKMIGEVTKSNKTKSLDKDLNNYKLFLEFWRLSYTDWSQNKGLIRSEMNVDSQNFDLTSVKLHQLKAIQKILPGKSIYCDIEADNEEWREVDLVGCGLMTKKGDDFYFIHETFGEFFAAQFIVRILSKPRVDANILELIEEIILVPKHEVVRMFLDEALVNVPKHSEKVKQLSSKMDKNLSKFQNIYEIFTKYLVNFDNLGDFFMSILKSGNDGKLTEILTESILKLVESSPISEKSQRIFLDLMISSVDIHTFDEVAAEIVKITNPNFIKEILAFKNIFFTMIKIPIPNARKFDKIFEILQKILSSSEIASKMKESDNNGATIMHNCVRLQANKKWKLFWKKYSKEDLNDVLMTRVKTNGQNVIHYAAGFLQTAENHKDFWELMLEMYDKNEESLKEIFMQRDSNEKNFLHILVKYGSAAALEDTLSNFKGTFSPDRFLEIFDSKCYWNESLMHGAARYSTDLEKHKVLWKFIDKPGKLFAQTESDGLTVFHYIATYSTAEILNFTVEKCEKVIPIDEMRMLLSKLDKKCYNILKTAAISNEQLDFHKSLWNILRKFFSPSEMIKFIRNRSAFGYNMIRYVYFNNTNEIVCFTLDEITRQVMSIEGIDEEMLNRLAYAKFSRIFADTTYGEEDLWQKFQQDEEIFELDFANVVHQPQEYSSIDELIKSQNDIESLAECTKLIFHEAFWKLSLEEVNEQKQTGKQELMEVLMRKNIFGLNFFHTLLLNKNQEVIEYTFDILKNNFSKEVIQEIVKSQNGHGNNLLQSAVAYPAPYIYLWDFIQENLEKHSILDILRHKNDYECNLLLHGVQMGIQSEVMVSTWTHIEVLFSTSCQDVKNELVEMMKERNSVGRNILKSFIISDNTTGEKLEFLWNKFQEHFGLNDSKALLSEKTPISNENILHVLAIYCGNVETHVKLWKLLSEGEVFSNKEELKEFVMGNEKFSNNFLHTLIQFNESSEVIEYTLWKMKDIFSRTQLVEILMARGFCSYTLLHTAIRFTKNIKVHKALWRSFKNLNEVIPAVDSYGRNILHSLAIYSTDEILDFVIEELKYMEVKENIKELIMKIDSFGSNVLHLSAQFIKELEFHETLWELIHEFLDEKEFSTLIYQIDSDGDNIIQVAAQHNNKEVVMYTSVQAFKFMTEEEKDDYLAMKNYEGLNFRGVSAKYRC